MDGPATFKDSPEHRRTLQLLGRARARPSEGDLRAAVESVVLEHKDRLNELNVKRVRELVEELLRVDLHDQRQWVRETVKAVISEHFDSAGDAAVDERGVAPPTVAATGVGLRLVLPPRAKGPSLLAQLDNEAGFDGGIGAIGRLSVRGDRDLTIDLRGRQYKTVVRPCASFLIVAAHDQREARVESVVDEFCELSDGHDIMAQLSGVVLKGRMDKQDTFAGDVDVNVVAKLKRGRGASGGAMALSATPDVPAKAKRGREGGRGGDAPNATGGCGKRRRSTPPAKPKSRTKLPPESETTLMSSRDCRLRAHGT